MSLAESIAARKRGRGNASPALRDSTAAVESSSAERFAALSSRNFRLLWAGMLVTNAGTWMESTATAWLVTDLEPERASFWLGVIAIAFAAPMLILPPFGGALADRWPRLRLLWVVQSIYLILSVILTVLTLTDAIEIWILAAYAFATGVVLAVDSPVRHALLPDLVDRRQLPSAVSLNSVAFTGAALVGPALAGILIPVVGVGGVFAVKAITCGATLYALWRLEGDFNARPSTHGSSVLRAIATGFKYIRRTPLIATLLVVSTIGGLFARSYTPLLAVFARDEYHVGSAAYGALVSVGGLGTLIGAFGLAGRREVQRKNLLIVVALLTQAACLVLLALSPWFGAALPLLLIAGIANALYGATIATLIQLTVPGELRGRVMSIYMLTVIGIPSVGAFLVGATADMTGVRVAVGLAGMIVIIAMVLLAMRNRAFLRAT